MSRGESICPKAGLYVPRRVYPSRGGAICPQGEPVRPEAGLSGMRRTYLSRGGPVRPEACRTYLSRGGPVQVRGQSPGRVQKFEGNVTKFVPHKALKLIA